MNYLILTGLVVGFAFGFALQRGRFCMNSAFRDIILLKEYTILKAVGLAIIVSMIGFSILSMAGVITLAPKPFFWAANMIGGFIFGIGMVVAGGCASGITYRTGEGMVGAMSAVVGFTLAALMTAMGVFKPVADYLQKNTKVQASDGANLTLANTVNVSPELLAIGIAALVLIIWAIFHFKNAKKADFDEERNPEAVPLSTKIFKRGWGWLETGLVIGIIGIIAFVASAEAGRNYPLGITGGYTTIFGTLITGNDTLSWESMLVIGAIFGAFIAAFIAKEFAIRAPAPKVLIQTFFGGFMMGFGAVLSKGCNIGHILSGVPQLSVGSIVGGGFIILGCWTAVYFLFMKE